MPAYEVYELNDGGSISGTVRWTGPRPEVEQHPDREHGDVCGATQPSAALVVSGRDGVANAVVALVDVRRGRALTPPEEPPRLAQEGCRFVPHVLALVAGWPLDLVNRDPLMHNVRGRVGGRTVFDVGLPTEGATAREVLSEPGVVSLGCDVGHTWQRAWLHVYEHPYFATTDEHGGYRLNGVPPGRYTIRVWHEGWRIVGSESGRPVYSSAVILTRSVSVSPRQETRVDFELSQQAAEIAGE